MTSVACARSVRRRFVRARAFERLDLGYLKGAARANCAHGRAAAAVGAGASG